MLPLKERRRERRRGSGTLSGDMGAILSLSLDRMHTNDGRLIPTKTF